MDKIIKKLKEQYQNEKLILAISTGVDSTVLLDLLLKSVNHENIYLCFVNHKIRKQADIEEEYIKKYSKEHNLKLFIKHLDKIDNNFEEEARNQRLDFFLKVAKDNNIKYIFLAHHADDNLETMIMRFLRSSSLKGYSGMEEVTKYKDYYLIRPLIEIDKQTIINYATNNNLTYFNDHTNLENDHLRNRIRNNIIPLLKEENPNLINTSIIYSNNLRDSANFILEEVYNYINNNITLNNNDLVLNLNNFTNLNPFFQKQVLFEALKRYYLSINQINEIYDNIHNSKNKIIYSINNELKFIKEYNLVTFTTKKINQEYYELFIDKAGIYKLNNLKIEITKNNCYVEIDNKKLCYNIDELPITIRSRKDSDKIRRIKKDKITKEITYYNQSLSNYFTNKKIKYLDRLNTLLIVNKNNEVLDVIYLNK